MKTHKEVAALLQTAQREQRCAIGDGGKLYTALRRRTKIGEVVSPYPNLFAATSYWKSLNVEQQSMHLIRALARVHPTWTFAGLSAACVYQYEHSYSLHNGTVDIVSPKGANCGGASGLNRIYMARCSQYRCQGILVTSPARTLIDCASLPFDKALAIYDSALRLQHVTKLDVETLIVQTDCNETNVKRLLRYANPLRENGGESWTYARIRQLGFAEPLFQTEFDNPANPEMPYRVDFCWKLHDERIIVVEYDGIAKYRDTSNPNRANLMAKFEYERQRDANLKTQGVTSIKHLFYEDVSDLKRLNALLTAIGIPKIR